MEILKKKQKNENNCLLILIKGVLYSMVESRKMRVLIKKRSNP